MNFHCSLSSDQVLSIQVDLRDRRRASIKGPGQRIVPHQDANESLIPSHVIGYLDWGNAGVLSALAVLAVLALPHIWGKPVKPPRTVDDAHSSQNIAGDYQQLSSPHL